MEAKDTVLKVEEVFCNNDWDEGGGYRAKPVKNALLIQAKVAFEAGEDQGYGNGYITGVNDATRKAVVSCNEALVTGRKAGIKEVVNWMNLNCLGCRSNTLSNSNYYWGFHKESWQAQLKEWFATKNGG